MFIRASGFEFFRPGSASKNLSILNPIVTKLSEIWSGMFIPDPDLDFLPIPDLGGQKDTESRIPDPDPQHYSYAFQQVCESGEGRMEVR